jgi:hypothetical protein
MVINDTLGQHAAARSENRRTRRFLAPPPACSLSRATVSRATPLPLPVLPSMPTMPTMAIYAPSLPLSSPTAAAQRRRRYMIHSRDIDGIRVTTYTTATTTSNVDPTPPLAVPRKPSAAHIMFDLGAVGYVTLSPKTFRHSRIRIGHVLYRVVINTGGVDIVPCEYFERPCIRAIVLHWKPTNPSFVSNESKNGYTLLGDGYDDTNQIIPMIKINDTEFVAQIALGVLNAPTGTLIYKRRI